MNSAHDPLKTKTLNLGNTEHTSQTQPKCSFENNLSSFLLKILLLKSVLKYISILKKFEK